LNIEVKVVTNAKKRDIIREGNGLRVKLTSLPVEGRANDELLRYLSDIFNIKRSEVKILKGDKDKRKLVSIPIDEGIILEKISGKKRAP